MELEATYEDQKVHLGYCTNIHPGESLEEVIQALSTYSRRIRDQVCPGRAMGIGLRLSKRAADELLQPGQLDAFAAGLEEWGLYVFSLNGFPYGAFHGEVIKEAVYRPDWTSEARQSYTLLLAELAARLVPPGQRPSISTVPGGFRPLMTGGAKDEVRRRLVQTVGRLFQLSELTGRDVVLALEPEPHCMLETTEEAVEMVLQCRDRQSVSWLMEATGLGRGEAEVVLQRHLGLCIDACHAAVEFENMAESVALCRRSGVEIAKLQVSCGLAVDAMNPARSGQLRKWADDVYLHQTVIRRNGVLERHLDLPEALRKYSGRSDEEWRVHFHVPIFKGELGGFRSTQAELRELLRLQQTRAFTAHLEVETYTWGVLPQELRSIPIQVAIARELSWVLNLL